MTHRRLLAYERANQHLRLHCPYAVDVVQEPPGIDNRNALPWTRLYVPHARGPGNPANAVSDLAARRRHALRAGTLLLLPPQRLYGFRFMPGMRMLAFHFRLEWAPGCDAFAALDRCLEAPADAGLVRALHAAVADHDGGGGLAAAGALHGLLLALAARFITVPMQPGARIQAALQRLAAGCRADFPLTALARESGVGRERFSRQFNHEVGMPPREYLHRRLVEAAAARLIAGGRVKDVAAGLGFTSEFYFSRFFRRRTGVAPREFRVAPPA